MPDEIAPAAPAAPSAPATLLAAPPAAPAAPSAPAAPAAWNWAKEDGTLSPGWQDKLPEDLRGHASLKVIGSLPDLAKSYVETKKMIGSKLEAPGEGATPEQITAWRKVVGAPEKPEGYLAEGQTSLRPDAIPEALWDKASEAKFVALAHKHHLPPAAVKEILGFYGESMASSLQASQVDEAKVLADEGVKLKTTWGKDYDTNLALASRVAQTVGLDPKTHPIFTSAETVQAFAKMGKLLSETALVKGESPGISGSIAEKVREISDPASTNPLARDYRGENGPERQQAAQAQLHNLYAAQKAAA